MHSLLTVAVLCAMALRRPLPHLMWASSDTPLLARLHSLPAYVSQCDHVGKPLLTPQIRLPSLQDAIFFQICQGSDP
ncbi:hypothetical protein KC19_VG262100 [Ceratodon purpureus]|uniref:Secreted protein n=1 Tax=Ceratodon purpureus TaxID=3225 RepID=A0A8T0HUG9_CERPU|nr:hypothetical protein KC19_VG262100 [Ceratodon purpureus]